MNTHTLDVSDEMGIEPVITETTSPKSSEPNAVSKSSNPSPRPNSSRRSWPLLPGLFAENIELLLAAITLLFLLIGWIGGSLTNTLAPIAVFACAGIAYAAGGYSGVTGAIEEMRKGKLDIDFLMVAAAIGAALIGEWEEGALLLFLFTLSGALEEFAMDRTRNAIEALADLRPDTAQRIQDGQEATVPVSALALQETVLVRPGERIPVDGQVSRGRSSVDQSPITGESIPVGKAAGDEVFAGTINGGGAIEVTVTKLAEQSTLNQIIQLVEDAREDAVPAQRFIDRFSQPYTLFVIGLTLAAIAIPQIFSSEPFSQTFYRAMTLLVVASPCALVISTPASILSAIAAAAREGLLFKGGVHLENLAQVTIAAFDKTGTLTKGQPAVTDIHALGSFSDTEVLRLAASTESLSEHHLAQAIVNKAQADDVPLEKPISFEAIAGKGVRAVLQQGTIFAGNDKLFRQMTIDLPAHITEAGQKLQQEGKTAVLIAHAEGEVLVDEVETLQPVGFIAIADTLREDAAQNVQALRQQGIEQIAMLTGDNQDVAHAIGNQLGIDKIYSELLPHEKVKVLTQLQNQGPTLMIGDGVNDAPALAIADVGVAMGATGTDAALETADLVLMGDRLSRLAFALRLSKQAQRTVKQNVAFSIGVMLILMALTVVVPLFWQGFQLPLPLGVIGHEGSTLLVVANGLRLLGLRSEA